MNINQLLVGVYHSVLFVVLLCLSIVVCAFIASRVVSFIAPSVDPLFGEVVGAAFGTVAFLFYIGSRAETTK